VLCLGDHPWAGKDWEQIFFRIVIIFCVGMEYA